MLELLTQGIPESPMVKLCVRKHPEHADDWKGTVSHDRPDGKLVYPGVHADDRQDEHTLAH